MIILRDQNTNKDTRLNGTSFPQKGGDIYNEQGQRLSITQISWQIESNQLIPILTYINSETSPPITGTQL